MADRPGQPIQPDHDQRFTRADLAQQPRQHGPAAIGAGRVLLEHDRAAGRAQLVELRISVLILGRHTGVTDKAATYSYLSML